MSFRSFQINAPPVGIVGDPAIRAIAMILGVTEQTASAEANKTLGQQYSTSNLDIDQALEVLKTRGRCSIIHRSTDLETVVKKVRPCGGGARYGTFVQLSNPRRPLALVRQTHDAVEALPWPQTNPTAMPAYAEKPVAIKFEPFGGLIDPTKDGDVTNVIDAARTAGFRYFEYAPDPMKQLQPFGGNPFQ